MTGVAGGAETRLHRGLSCDGTITLEVFTADRHFLSYSRDVLRKVWDDLGASEIEAPCKVTALTACCKP